MSFPKAKITRFYEEELTCAPPPGKYSPKYDCKVKLALFDKGERFTSPKLDLSSSAESIDSCSKHSSSRRTSTPRVDKLELLMSLPDKFHIYHLSQSDQKLLEEINQLTQIHQKQMMEKNEEVSRLIEKINHLNERMSHLTLSQASGKSKEECEEEIDRLKKELSCLQGTISSNSNNYKQQVASLKSQISSFEEIECDDILMSKKFESSFRESCQIYDHMNSQINEMANEFTLQLDDYVEFMNKSETINKYLFEDYKCTLELLKKESEENAKNKEMLMALQDNINLCKDDLSEALKHCKLYEVAQKETSKTINVLNKRLKQSECEVNHLNDIQAKLLDKKSNLKENVDSLSIGNLVIRGSLDSLQQTVQLEIEALQKQIVEKVETFKVIAFQESEKQKECIDEKQKTIDILLTDIDSFKSQKAEDDSRLNSCYAKIDNYLEEIRQLKAKISDLEKVYEKDIGAQKALYFQLSEDHESLKKFSRQEKEQMEQKFNQLSNDKSALESACAQQTNKIVLLEALAEETNHKLSQSQIRIGHLENLTNEYDTENNKLVSELKDKVKIIGNLEQTKSRIENEKLQLIEEKITLEKSLSSQIEECNVLEEKLKQECFTVSEIKKELQIVEVSNQKFTDEISTELALEKETVVNLETQKKELLQENLQLEKVLSDMKDTITALEEEIENKVNREDFEDVMKKLKDKVDTVKVLEHEKVIQSQAIAEYKMQNDNLLKNIEAQNNEIEYLKETVSMLNHSKSELEEKINNLLHEQKRLKEAGKEDIAKVSTLEATLADLESKNKELNEIIGPFKSQLMQYELEKSFLLSKSKDAENALKSLQLEHAKSLGHQNQKQKIKHIVNLNQSINSLKKDVEKYRLENIKLKSELTAKKPSSLPEAVKNKENSSKRPTGRKPGPSTALKDRNG